MNEKPEFLKDAVNVYRTKKYIVKQDLYMETNIDNEDYLFSKDTFYLRNKKIDKLYEMIFSDRKNIDGKRIHCSSYSRKYID
ncbi:MAG: hypothetical protein ACI4R8_03715 [Candidatus Caccovivens sp.]